LAKTFSPKKSSSRRSLKFIEALDENVETWGNTYEQNFSGGNRVTFTGEPAHEKKSKIFLSTFLFFPGGSSRAPGKVIEALDENV
jgi:hypothetical protein